MKFYTSDIYKKNTKHYIFTIPHVLYNVLHIASIFIIHNYQMRWDEMTGIHINDKTLISWPWIRTRRGAPLLQSAAGGRGTNPRKEINQRPATSHQPCVALGHKYKQIIFSWDLLNTISQRLFKKCIKSFETSQKFQQQQWIAVDKFV